MTRDNNSYLRITIENADFLLPSAVSLAIVKRNELKVNTTSDKYVAAWKADKGGDWPAIALDSNLDLSPRSEWQRAVFLHSVLGPVGMLADEILLLSDVQIIPEPFTPIGPKVRGTFQLFSSAWVDEDKVTLIFDPQTMASYLYMIRQGR